MTLVKWAKVAGAALLPAAIVACSFGPAIGFKLDNPCGKAVEVTYHVAEPGDDPLATPTAGNIVVGPTSSETRSSTPRLDHVFLVNGVVIGRIEAPFRNADYVIEIPERLC